MKNDLVSVQNQSTKLFAALLYRYQDLGMGHFRPILILSTPFAFPTPETAIGFIWDRLPAHMKEQTDRGE